MKCESAAEKHISIFQNIGATYAFVEENTDL